jgi:hypothetical protein
VRGNRVWAGLTAVFVGVVLSAWGTPAVRAADCGRTSVNLVPLTDLAPDRYLGYPGGLYPGGLNTPPDAHAAIAMGRSSEVQARRTDGTLAPNGRIVLLSLGMTFTSLEYVAFQQMAAGDPQINPAVLLVDGAQNTGFTDQVTQPTSAYWTGVDVRIQAAGATAAQVQVIWLKGAVGNPTGPFPEHAEALRDRLEAMVHIAQARFPNLQIVYFSSRAYGGYAQAGRPNPQRLNPEPYAYESAFAVRWLIEKQINGDAGLNPDPAKGPVTAPVLLWGPYLWADGLKARSDGVVWRCSDFQNDGTTPSAGGQQKVANMLMAFLKTHPTSVPWFLANPAVTPLPSATELPTQTIVPTNTPGPGRPTRMRPPTLTPTDGPSPTAGPSPTPGPTDTPVPLMSYRVREVPSGDEMWVSTNNPQVQAQLKAIDPARPTWVCGRVQAAPQMEWGFQFAPQSVTVIPDPPRQVRTTIRAIAANPGGGGLIPIRCIQVGQTVDEEPGRPPTPTLGTPQAATPGTGTPGSATPLPGTRTPATPTRTPTVRTGTPGTATRTPTRTPTVRSGTVPPATQTALASRHRIYLPVLVLKRASRAFVSDTPWSRAVAAVAWLRLDGPPSSTRP